MILIFGGTTEGRLAAKVCDEAEKTFFYATKGKLQQVEMANGKHLQGAMLPKDIVDFCKKNKINAIVDAAHPFALNLHNNIAEASNSLKIPVIRLERKYSHFKNDLVHYFSSYAKAISYLKQQDFSKLLALTGVNTISSLKPYWEERHTIFRILDREESHKKAKADNFPKEQLIYYQKNSDDLALFRSIKPSAIITKESGESGGLSEKVDAAIQLKIPILIVERPQLSPFFIQVNGKHGLRKQIEQLVPDFFELKTGYTTGTCATAATKAAFESLITGIEQTEIRISLPDGESVKLPITKTKKTDKSVSCTVIKDAGDDPDVIHGKEIISTVSFNSSHKGIVFLQGEGVGKITLPGLDIEIGEPAINKTPREMMRREIYKLKRHYPDKLPSGYKGVDITISVPEGKEIAQQTFNPRLGIIGGISIIGTSGIVKPYSAEAFVASIRREMQVAKALGVSHIVLNSGAKSEKFAQQLNPDLPEQAFIHFGNFIGSSIEIVNELAIENLTLVIMLGKAVKLADGHLDTHSKKVRMNKDFLTRTAQNSKCTTDEISQINNIKLARQLWTIISNPAFFQQIANMCYHHCKKLLPEGNLKVLLIDNEGKQCFESH